MTIEEKAKAYDEALKAAIAAHKDEDRHLKATLERIFPELKESKDERIRNQIINFIEEYGNPIHCEWQKDWIAWLEKQGGQKPANKVEPKFHEGDTIVEKDLDECGYGTIKEIKDGRYIFTDGSGINIDEQDGWELLKTSTNVKSKFKVGDWILIDKPCQVKSIDNYGNYAIQYSDSDF